MKYALSASWSDAVDPQGYKTLEFHVRREGDRLVTGSLWIPNGSIQSDTLMAFGHGASGTRYQLPIPYLARKFAKEGIVSLSMDGPVHGLRQKGEGGRPALSQEMRRSNMIEDMVVDWRAAVEVSESRIGFNTNKFGYFGLSMGSIFGIPYLAKRKQENEPVSVATLGLLGTTGAVSGLADRLKSDASSISAPTLFLMQLEDELFPRDGYLELFDALASDNKRLHANPGLHPAVPAEEMDFCVKFVLDHLIGNS